MKRQMMPSKLKPATGWHDSVRLDAIVAAACRPGPAAARRDPVADAMSNIVGELARAGEYFNPGHPGYIGYWLPSSKHEARAMVAGTASQGGNLLQSAMLERLVSAARPLTVLERAGAERISAPIGAGDLVLPRWDEAATGGWVGEGEPAGSVDLQVKTGNARPHIVASTIKVSRRLVLQTLMPIEGVILRELQRSNESLIESGFWAGLGAKDPLGIANTPGMASQSFAAAAPTWAEVAGMIDTYNDSHADYSRATFFAHPSMGTSLLTTPQASGTAQFIAQPGQAPRTLTVAGLPLYLSAAIPAGKLFLMDPTRVMIPFWDNPLLSVNPYRHDISGDVDLTVLNACDILLTDPAQVVVGSN